MLSLLITSTEHDVDVKKCHSEILKTVKTYEKDFQILFFVRENDKHLKEFATISSQTPNHVLMVADYKTTDDEMIYMGLDIFKNTNTILLTIDTLPEVLVDIIEKQRKDFQIVKVREIDKNGKDFFSKLGILAYNFGLKLYGKKNYDSFAEPKVGYFDGRIVNSLSKIVGDNKKARILNYYPQVKNGVLEEKQIFRAKEKSKVWNMFAYGMITFFYLLALVALFTIYPIFNNMFYSWWMIVAILIWILFGLLEALLVAKKVFLRRCGYGNKVDVNDQPLFDALFCVKFGDDVNFDEDENEETHEPQKTTLKTLKLNKPVLKTKKDVKKISKSKKLKKIKEVK